MQTPKFTNEERPSFAPPGCEDKHLRAAIAHSAEDCSCKTTRRPIPEIHNVPKKTIVIPRQTRPSAVIAGALAVILAISVGVYAVETGRDSDGDGLTDLVERVGWLTVDGPTFVTDPLKADTDGDGLSDSEEAGPRTASAGGDDIYSMRSDPTKADSDDDDLTDRWETLGWTSADGTRFRSDPLRSDSDDDGLSDGLEAGNLVQQWKSRIVFTPYSDPLSADSDDDGLSDAEEADLSLDPFAADTDQDGLPDQAEVDLIGTDADITDSDEDGFDDGFEVMSLVDRGLDPVRPDVKIDTATFALDFARGAFAGDIAPGDSTAWLAGNLTAGASSAVPVVGWAIGGAADLRDVVASSIRADWVSASYSAIGLVPVTGDVVSVPLKITKFLVKHPKLVAEVSRMVAEADWLDESAKIKAVAAAAPAAWDALRRSVGAQALIRLASGGTNLRSLADDIARANHVKGGTAPFLTRLTSAEKSLVAIVSTDSDAPNAQGAVVSTIGCGDTCNEKARRIDVLVDGIAHDAKLGYVRLTPSIEKQIRSDAFLIRSGAIQGARWHFFASSRSNSVGAAAGVLNLLDELDIAYTIHLPA